MKAEERGQRPPASPNRGVVSTGNTAGLINRNSWFKPKLPDFPMKKKRKRQPGNNIHHQRLLSLSKEDRVQLANEILADLPDGAFFCAAKEQFGLDPEDFIPDDRTNNPT